MELIFIYFARSQIKTNLLFGKKSHTESGLLKGLKNSDHDSFRKLFEQYSKPLYRFSLSYLKSNEAAEDIVQEVFIKIWDKRKDIDTEKSFQSYLFTIALNSVRKHFNKLAETNQLKHDIIASFSENQAAFDEQENFEDYLRKLDALIQQMPEKRKEIFIGKKLEGKSQKELADEFGITVKTVEYHITEAMKFLKEEFDKLRLGGMVFFCLFITKKN
ncbi:MAG TPA: RNA polymerase sigma-70 factor [Mariniphaga anaerophila]|uniref:RNA polymerase sigma factor n=1 Tax=Mariniphaga anaerophila TaxID=1484053 RepID=A0A831LYF5_9BACT|nr:RNA polymerase sigma-70 factor [Mariniphaga anaerophila]